MAPYSATCRAYFGDGRNESNCRQFHFAIEPVVKVRRQQFSVQRCPLRTEPLEDRRGAVPRRRSAEPDCPSQNLSQREHVEHAAQSMARIPGAIGHAPATEFGKMRPALVGLADGGLHNARHLWPPNGRLGQCRSRRRCRLKPRILYRVISGHNSPHRPHRSSPPGAQLSSSIGCTCRPSAVNSARPMAPSDKYDAPRNRCTAPISSACPSASTLAREKPCTWLQPAGAIRTLLRHSSSRGPDKRSQADFMNTSSSLRTRGRLLAALRRRKAVANQFAKHMQSKTNRGGTMWVSSDGIVRNSEKGYAPGGGAQ